MRAVLAAVDQRTHDLVLLSELLRRLEREPFETPLLRRLVKSLETDGTARLGADPPAGPAAQPARLPAGTSSSAHSPSSGSGRSQLALRIDAWRGGTGPADRATGSRRSASSRPCARSAAYAAENPADPSPSWSTGPARFEAEALGHPLIQPTVCVRNDVVARASRRAC